MLKAFGEPFLRIRPDNEGNAEFAYVEAWHYSDASRTRTRSFNSDFLDESTLENWAWQRGPFIQHVNISGSNRQLLGGLRILFVKPTTNFRIPQALTSSKVLQALHLPHCSYASYQQPSGAFSCHTYPEGSSIDSCRRLGLLLRTPQKWECTMGGISLAHDFETGITTALILSHEFRLDRHPPLDDSPSGRVTFESFLEQIRDSENLWGHPLLLPCLFLVAHTRRVRSYIMDNLSNEVVLVERSVGVTRAGRSQRPYVPSHLRYLQEQKLFEDGHLQREHAKTLTKSINDLSTWIIFAKRSPQWDIDCIKFLRRFLDESTRLLSYRDISAQTFRETLDYLQNYCEGCLEVTQTSEARMQLQLNILYTSVAQDDGQTSARIAASAGKDSTSMKIIALITASYLPATFVATLFSMNMFEWQTNDSGSGGDSAPERSVSPDFWIYWAVTVPLTFVTIAGWAVWWKFEEHRFDRNVKQATRDKSSQPNWAQNERPRGMADFAT